MNFAILPPEITSARIYSGPGPDSLLSAEKAWTGLAAELHAVADDYRYLILDLNSGEWLGAASESASEALSRFSAWLTTTSERAKHAATQAGAAAKAYEEAVAMTVPPSTIAANRAELESLLTSNVFGQNTSAIAAIETTYAEMWAQDVAAMYQYAGSSATATTLLPFSQPDPTTDSDGLAAQIGAISQATAWTPLLDGTPLDVLSSVPLALQALSLPNAFQQQHIPADLIELIDLAYEEGQIVTTPLSATSLLAGLQGIVPAQAADAAIGSELSTALTAPAVAGLNSETPAGPEGIVTATLSQANSIGALSVPTSWASTPTTIPATALSGTALTTLPETEAVGLSVPVLPGVPVGSVGRPSGAVPRYGLAVTVMPRPPAAG